MTKMRCSAVPTIVRSLPTIVLVSFRVNARSLRSCRGRTRESGQPCFLLLQKAMADYKVRGKGPRKRALPGTKPCPG